jgi:Polyketide cyclase / dehydrase and lipid transport
MKWVALAASLVVLAVAAVALVGSFLPRHHVASRSARFHRPLQAVWDIIADPLAGASWRSDVRSVERLPDRDGRFVWREKSLSGDALTLELVVDEPRHRRVVRIADPSLPFGGTWTYELVEEGEAVRVTITEHGEVGNPVFRFLARFVFGHGGTMETFLKMLGARLGEPVRTE